MSTRRRLNSSLIDDIVAVAAHLTEEVAFLRGALQVVAAAASSGLAASGHPTFAFIKAACSEALSMQGGGE